MTGATIGATYARLTSRGIRTVLACELTELAARDGWRAACDWCGDAAALGVALELVPAAEDEAEPGEPFGGAEVEREFCRRCVERVVPDAMAGVARVAGHDLSPGVQAALREGFGPLLRRLGASSELAASARFTVVAAPSVPTTVTVH